MTRQSNVEEELRGRGRKDEGEKFPTLTIIIDTVVRKININGYFHANDVKNTCIHILGGILRQKKIC